MEEFRVFIPEEYYSILSFNTENLPGVAVVNTALRDFEPKIVFAWHLSIMIELEDLIDNGMPSGQEVEVIDSFGDDLDDAIKGPNLEKPNALFLARITWNGTRELIYRVFDPEVANSYLQEIINTNDYVRPFDYRMEEDEDWKLTEWHLKDYSSDS